LAGAAAANKHRAPHRSHHWLGLARNRLGFRGGFLASVQARIQIQQARRCLVLQALLHWIFKRPPAASPHRGAAFPVGQVGPMLFGSGRAWRRCGDSGRRSDGNSWIELWVTSLTSLFRYWPNRGGFLHRRRHGVSAERARWRPRSRVGAGVLGPQGARQRA